jgi:hypothetical protein
VAIIVGGGFACEDVTTLACESAGVAWQFGDTKVRWYLRHRTGSGKIRSLFVQSEQDVTRAGSVQMEQSVCSDFGNRRDEAPSKQVG